MDLEKQMQDIRNMVVDIHRVVLGSEHEKDLGLLSRVRELEERIIKVDMILKRAKWVMIGMAIPASWGIRDLIEILTK